MRRSYDEAMAFWQLERNEVCCANCESFDGKWCVENDYRVLRPWAFRCLDFYQKEDE